MCRGLRREARVGADLQASHYLAEEAAGLMIDQAALLAHVAAQVAAAAVLHDQVLARGHVHNLRK